MSLRVQLFGVALLTLALPWAGYRYVQELEGALRDGLEQALIASASTMAAALELQPLTDAQTVDRTNVDEAIYAHPLSASPDLDGYRDDWTSSPDTARRLSDDAEYWAGLLDRFVYVYLSVVDDDLIYQRAPTETPYGDRAILLPGGATGGWLLLHRAGPGGVLAQRVRAPLFAPTLQYEARVTGYWRETERGYDLELRLPIDLVGDRLGLGVIDVDRSAADGYDVSLDRSWSAELDSDPGAFIFQPQYLGNSAGSFVQPGRRMRVVDRLGWIMYDGGEIDPMIDSFAPPTLTLTERFFRLVLARGGPPYQGIESPPGRVGDTILRASLAGDPIASWFARGTDASSIVVAATPIRSGSEIDGAVILEQSSDSILTLTNDALVRLMSFTLLASLIVALGLLSYATLLSIRIRRLARAADTALSPEGEIRTSLPGRRAGDEIGDLARSFGDLLNRLREYTEYLTTLKAKLAHELRTPLAVVTTSLDNLDKEARDGHLEPYLTRLRDGADRLDAILNSMSEATLIEQAVNDTEPSEFEIGSVVSSCVSAYRDVYADRKFALDDSAPGAIVLGSADLVAQMLDKLIDNAVSFSPEQSTITIVLGGNDRELTLSVANEGPPLPDSMRSHLFDSLVSVRAEKGERRHLGLGLYIVSLIVDFHRGRIRAENLPDGSGVGFAIELPRGR